MKCASLPVTRGSNPSPEDTLVFWGARIYEMFPVMPSGVLSIIGDPGQSVAARFVGPGADSAELFQYAVARGDKVEVNSAYSGCIYYAHVPSSAPAHLETEEYIDPFADSVPEETFGANADEVLTRDERRARLIALTEPRQRERRSPLFDPDDFSGYPK